MQSWRATIAIVSGVSAYSVALGATYASLSLDLQSRGYSPTEIAISAAMTPLGLFVSALLLPKIARGTVFVWLLCGIVATSFSMIALWMWSSYQIWLLLRFILGVSANVLFVVGESALMMRLPDNRSGQVLSVYNGVVTLGYAAGPVALTFTHSNGNTALLLCGLGVLLAIGPICYAARQLSFPLPPHEAGSGLLVVALSAPALVIGSAATAIYDNAALSLMPLFAIDAGLGKSEALTLLSITLVGATVLQWPLGYAADRVGALRILRICAIVTAVSMTALPWVISSWPTFATAALVFAAGGAAFGAYSMVLVLVRHHFRAALLIAANAALGLMWGLGSFVGVPLVGASMETMGQQSFGPAVSLPFIALLLLTFIPIIIRGRRPAHADGPVEEERNALQD